MNKPTAAEKIDVLCRVFKAATKAGDAELRTATSKELADYGVTCEVIQAEHPLAGMSLRDYFAAKALIAMAPAASERRMPDSEVAQCAYALADAMMREREKAGGT